MTTYQQAYKKWNNFRTGKAYELYVRFSPRVNVEDLAKDLGRKGIPDFGGDRNNTLSASWIFSSQSKNFMLELKKGLKKDKDIKEVSIREVKK
jgi:hypothetical protein